MDKIVYLTFLLTVLSSGLVNASDDVQVSSEKKNPIINLFEAPLRAFQTKPGEAIAVFQPEIVRQADGGSQNVTGSWFQAGQSLGSQVSSLTGWLTNRLLANQQAQQEQQQSASSTTEKPQPDVVVQVQQIKPLESSNVSPTVNRRVVRIGPNKTVRRRPFAENTDDIFDLDNDDDFDLDDDLPEQQRVDNDNVDDGDDDDDDDDSEEQENVAPMRRQQNRNQMRNRNQNVNRLRNGNRNQNMNRVQQQNNNNMRRKNMQNQQQQKQRKQQQNMNNQASKPMRPQGMKQMNNRPMNNKPMNNGPMKNRPMNNGPMNNRPMNNRPMNNGPMNNGPMNDGPMNNGGKRGFNNNNNNNIRYVKDDDESNAYEDNEDDDEQMMDMYEDKENKFGNSAEQPSTQSDYEEQDMDEDYMDEQESSNKNKNKNKGNKGGANKDDDEEDEDEENNEESDEYKNDDEDNEGIDFDQYDSYNDKKQSQKITPIFTSVQVTPNENFNRRQIYSLFPPAMQQQQQHSSQQENQKRRKQQQQKKQKQQEQNDLQQALLNNQHIIIPIHFIPDQIPYPEVAPQVIPQIQVVAQHHHTVQNTALPVYQQTQRVKPSKKKQNQFRKQSATTSRPNRNRKQEKKPVRTTVKPDRTTVRPTRKPQKKDEVYYSVNIIAPSSQGNANRPSIVATRPTRRPPTKKKNTPRGNPAPAVEEEPNAFRGGLPMQDKNRPDAAPQANSDDLSHQETPPQYVAPASSMVGESDEDGDMQMKPQARTQFYLPQRYYQILGSDKFLSVGENGRFLLKSGRSLDLDNVPVAEQTAKVMEIPVSEEKPVSIPAKVAEPEVKKDEVEMSSTEEKNVAVPAAAEAAKESEMEKVVSVEESKPVEAESSKEVDDGTVSTTTERPFVVKDESEEIQHTTPAPPPAKAAKVLLRSEVVQEKQNGGRVLVKTLHH